MNFHGYITFSFFKVVFLLEKMMKGMEACLLSLKILGENKRFLQVEEEILNKAERKKKSDLTDSVDVWQNQYNIVK